MLRRAPLILFVWVGLVAGLLAGPCLAHPLDEVRQVSLQVKIDDDSVTQQVRLPLAFALQEVFDGEGLQAFRARDGQDKARLLAQAMAALNPVEIDGVAVGPVIENVRVESFLPGQPISAFPDAELMQGGSLSFDAVYATLGQRPRRVAMTWRQIAPEREASALETREGRGTGTVVASVQADGKATLAVFSMVEPQYIWHSGADVAAPVIESMPPRNAARRSLPALAFGVVLVSIIGVWLIQSFPVRLIVGVSGLSLAGICLGTGLGAVAMGRPEGGLVRPGDEQALEIFTALHRNIYRAFDYTDESAVYDALAQSVDGPELEAIYNDIYQSLILREEGGAVCRIQRVTIDEATLLEGDQDAEGESGSFRVRCRWRVEGLVQHFGHTHARTNAFAADYTLAPRNGRWRIIQTRVIEQERTDDGKQTLEDLFDLGEEGGEKPSNPTDAGGGL